MHCALPLWWLCAYMERSSWCLVYKAETFKEIEIMTHDQDGGFYVFILYMGVAMVFGVQK